MNIVRRVLGLSRSNAGASAAEYALMIAFVTGVIVTGAALLGTKVSLVFENFAPKMTTPT